MLGGSGLLCGDIWEEGSCKVVETIKALIWMYHHRISWHRIKHLWEHRQLIIAILDKETGQGKLAAYALKMLVCPESLQEDIDG